MGTYSIVNVQGLGPMPDRFEVKFDGIDIRDAKGGNKRSEKYVSLRCGEDPFWNDDFTLIGWQTTTGYGFGVRIDADSRVAFWNDGYIRFMYDSKEKWWTAKADINGKEWKFCEPVSVLDNVISGLWCFVEMAEGYDNIKSAIARIANGLERDKKFIVNGMPAYEDKERTVCSK